MPDTWLAGERTQRVTTLLPVALLAALVVVQTVVGPGGSLVLDARIVAVGVAVVLLMLRANFLVIVLAAGATAALLRRSAGVEPARCEAGYASSAAR